MGIMFFSVQFIFINTLRNPFIFAAINRTKAEVFSGRAAEYIMDTNSINLASTMAMVMLPESVWEEVTSDLKELKELVKCKEEEKSDWIESVEARKMLGVSHKTWQTYRDKRVIPYVQFGRKIMVKRADIDAFMDSHYISRKEVDIK